MNLEAAITGLPNDAQSITAARQSGDLTLALALAAAAEAAQPDAPLVITEHAEVLGELGRRDDMAAAYRRAIAADPNQAATVLTHARSLRQQGDWPGAAALLGIVAEFRPNSINVQTELAFALWQIQNVDGAALAYRRVLAIDATHAGALAALGRIEHRRGNHPAALELFDQAFKQGRNDRTLREEAAHSMIQLNRLEDAAALLQSLLNETPDDTKLMTALSRLRAQQGNAEAAVQLLRDAALRQPTAELHFAIGGALRDMGRPGEAETSLLAAVELKPDFAAAWFQLGNLARSRGDDDVALVRYCTAAAADPGCTLDVVTVLIQLNRPDEAASLLQGMPDKATNDHRRLLLQARIKRLQGDTGMAVGLLNAAAENCRSPQAYIAVGAALRELGEPEAAESAFTAAVTLRPDHAPAMLQLGMLARGQGDDEVALAWFEKAAAAEPSNPSHLFEVASSLLDLRRVVESEAVMARVDAMPEAATHTHMRLRRLEHYCKNLRIDDGLACVAEFGTHRQLPTRAVSWAAGLYAARGDWAAVLQLFAERVVPGRGDDFVPATELVAEAVARAARATGRQAEVIGLLPGWQAADAAEAVNLRDQLAEELLLLHEVRPGGAKPRVAPEAKLRAERSARLAKVLSASAAPVQGTIFLCSDVNYLPGTIVAVASVLRHNRLALRDCRFCVFLSEDAMPIAAPMLGLLSTAYGLPIEAVPVTALSKPCKGLRKDWGTFTPGHRLSDAAYYRILAALWLAEAGRPGHAVYLDSDTCMGPGLADMLRFDLAGKPLGARFEEWLAPPIRRAARKLEMDPEVYFNSGVLIFDLEHPKAVPALRHAFQVAEESPERLSFMDQCALNLAFLGQMTPLPDEFNLYVRQKTDMTDLPMDAPVMHFLGRPKPWDPAYCTANATRWLTEFYALADILEPGQLRSLMAMPFADCAVA